MTAPTRSEYRPPGASRPSLIRASFRRHVASLAPIRVPDDGDHQIRLLCGRRSVLEAIAALQSFLRFDDGRAELSAPVFLHDDGTLRRRDWLLFRRRFPGARLVPRAEADRRMRAALEARRLPGLAALRRDHVLALKLLDIPLLAGASRVLYLDSDVICHRPPVELRRALRDPHGRLVDRFNLDASTWYAWEPERLERRFGVAILPAVNSGLLAFTPDTAAWPLLEDCLALERLPGREWYVEQTLWAVALTLRGAAPLPPDYDVSARHAARRRSVVTQHFCGRLKPYFHERWLAELDGRAVRRRRRPPASPARGGSSCR